MEMVFFVFFLILLQDFQELADFKHSKAFSDGYDIFGLAGFRLNFSNIYSF
jgi:hypothetical protein